MKNLVWLASYPKSGNTWLRVFLTAYENGPGVALDINSLDGSLHAADRSLFDRVVGFSASDLTPAEIDRLRPEVYRSLAAEANGPLFLKVHDAWRLHDQAGAVFPADASRLAVYVVRNPLAVAPSLANHYGLTIDAAINQMASPQFVIANPGRKLKPQLPQFMGSWSDHVASWLTQEQMPVHVLRYEDLSADPFGEFSKLVGVCGLPMDAERLAWALGQSRFERLQAAEASQGFKERLAFAPKFFRQGKANAWREELSDTQIRQIVDRHGEWMQRLGYPLEVA